VSFDAATRAEILRMGQRVKALTGENAALPCWGASQAIKLISFVAQYLSVSSSVRACWKSTRPKPSWC